MKKLLLAIVCCYAVAALGQVRKPSLISGPMIGHVELRTAVIWVEAGYRGELSLQYFPAGKPNQRTVQMPLVVDSSVGNYILKFELTWLEPGSEYQYEVMRHGRQVLASGRLRTQQLWQYRMPAPDFSFLTGSCTYFNEPKYDRPGRPYGSDSIIFRAMDKEKADFMLWLGDNWYLREVDYFSEWGIHYRPSMVRREPVLQPFLKAMPHYAIWDDHDYGWNDADKSYPFKKTSREVFKKYWANPTYGQNDQGIYTKFTWNDVDVFMLDGRWFRSNDDMPDSVNGMPNPEKRMLGAAQMEWLKNALLQSNANRNISFRIIASGSQVLNPKSPFDCLRHFPAEYDELMRFIADHRINGVVFLTGDRHHSEVIRVERPGTYPMYDVTVSSLTAGISAARGVEKENPARLLEVNEHNYGRISFSGEKENRRMQVEFMNVRGEKITEWSVLLKDVTNR